MLMNLALSDRRCEHFFHLLLRHPTVWAVVHEALTNSRTQNTFDTGNVYDKTLPKAQQTQGI